MRDGLGNSHSRTIQKLQSEKNIRTYVKEAGREACRKQKGSDPRNRREMSSEMKTEK